MGYWGLLRLPPLGVNVDPGYGDAHTDLYTREILLYAGVVSGFFSLWCA